MTYKKNLKKTVVAIGLVVIPSFAMHLNQSSENMNKVRRSSVPAALSSGQNSPRANSPRSLGLSSPRNSATLSLNRSGSNSDIAIAAVAQSTLKRVATPDTLATFKKKTSSVGSLISPRTSEAPVEKLSHEERLADLRSSLDRSKSPLEHGEADLVYGEQDLEDALRKLNGLKILRPSVFGEHN